MGASALGGAKVVKKVFGGSALVVAVLIGSMMAAVVPVEPAVAVPDGETDCGDDVGEGVPTFTVTALVVSSGGDCTGAVKIPAGVIEI